MHELTYPTVMVAHACPDTRTMLKFWLESEGCRVVEATNGEEAVEMSRNQCPDLILMSERMPLLGGVDAARRIREKGENCVFPIVALSAYPTKEAQAQALAAGCDSFLTQPIDFDDLRALLGRLLHGSARSAAAGDMLKKQTS